MADDLQDVDFMDDNNNSGPKNDDDVAPQIQEEKEDDNVAEVIEVDTTETKKDDDDDDDTMNKNADSKESGSKYASINLYRPQRTTSPRSISIIATEERKGRVQKHTVYVIEMDPSPPGVITVARRYNDFKWLRTVLSNQFPGLFVPPLPPGNVIGRFENSFIEERRQDLQRFLRRVEEVKPFAESMAFGMFLSRPETTFVEGKKEVEAQIDVRTDEEIAITLNKLFPDLEECELSSTVHDEDIPLLKEFLTKIDQQMTLLNKSAMRLFKHLNFVSKEMISFHDSFDGLYSAETNYPYKATQQRLDVRPQFKLWSSYQTKQTDSYYDNFFRELRYEHEDIRALLELFKFHEVTYKKYQKVCKSIDKWTEMDANGAELKPNQERQKDIDYKVRKELLAVLDIFTKIILKNEIILIWNNKTTKWRDKIQIFSNTQNKLTQKMLDGWKNIAENHNDDNE